MFRVVLASMVFFAAVIIALPVENVSLGALQRRHGYPGSYRGAGSTQFSSETSSSSSVEIQVSSLTQQIRSCQSSFSSQRIEISSAQQQLTQLASQFQSVFSSVNSIRVDGSSFGGLSTTFSQLFTEFSSLITTCQQSFGERWTDLFTTSFSQFSSSFEQFFNQCSELGLDVRSFVPRNLIPTFSDIGLSGVESFFSSKNYHSSSSSFQSGGGTNRFSSETSSSSSVETRVSSLTQQIQFFQSSFSSQRIEISSAQQQLTQLASQFQSVFSSVNSIGNGGNNIAGLSSTFSQLFRQFSSLITTCQQSFGQQWTDVFQPSFAPISGSFEQFFNQCTNLGLNVRSFVPQNLIPTFGDIGLSRAESFFSSKSSSSSSTSFQSGNALHQ